MKKLRRTRLQLNHETIRVLTPAALLRANGGEGKTKQNGMCSESFGGVGANTACDTALSVSCGYDLSGDLCK